MSPNARKPNETQTSFRERPKQQHQYEQHRARGRVVWDSRNLGTYVRAKHGELGRMTHVTS